MRLIFGGGITGRTTTQPHLEDGALSTMLVLQSAMLCCAVLCYTDAFVRLFPCSFPLHATG
mgnify:CR=1 FL=1